MEGDREGGGKGGAPLCKRGGHCLHVRVRRCVCRSPRVAVQRWPASVPSSAAGVGVGVGLTGTPVPPPAEDGCSGPDGIVVDVQEVFSHKAGRDTFLRVGGCGCVCVLGMLTWAGRGIWNHCRCRDSDC
jgi:hypothetical protein